MIKNQNIRKIKIINIYAPNNSTKIHEWKTELNREMYKCTIRVGIFSAPFSIINGTSRQNINKDLEDLNNAKLSRPQRNL